MTDALQTPATAETTAPADGPFTPDMIADVFGEQPEGDVVPDAKPQPAKVETPAEDPKVAQRIAAATRAELKAAQERQAAEATRKQLADQKAAQDARDAEQKLIDEDPAEYFRLKKLGPAAITRHLEKLAGTYKPEAVQEQKLSAVEQELAELKKQLADKEAAEKQTAVSVQQSAAEKAAGETFIADINANIEKYPNLAAEFDEQEVVALGFAQLRAVIGHDAAGNPVTRGDAFERDNGRRPTHDELALFLDGVAKARIEKRSKAAWRKQDSAPLSGSQPSGDLPSAPPVKGSSPRTLSSRDTSQRAAAPRSAVWSQEQADEESLRILERSRK